MTLKNELRVYVQLNSASVRNFGFNEGLISDVCVEHEDFLLPPAPLQHTSASRFTDYDVDIKEGKREVYLALIDANYKLSVRFQCHLSLPVFTPHTRRHIALVYPRKALWSMVFMN